VKKEVMPMEVNEVVAEDQNLNQGVLFR